jgi:hypothetical protein
MQKLLGKISVVLSADIPSIYTEGRYLDLEVDLADGTTLKERCEQPRGAWGTPPITDAEVQTKARDCLGLLLDPDQVETCIALAGRLDGLAPEELRLLIATAGGFGSKRLLAEG